MNKNRRSFYQFLIILVAAILLSVAIPSQVGAQSIIQGDSLPTQTMINGDAIFHGDTVRIDGDVDGDVLAIANEVEINGRVSGSLVVIGNEVFINSGIGGTLYALALQFDLGSEANLNRNLYFGGLSLNTQEGSQIQRDLRSMTLGAQLNGIVNGTIRAIIGPMEFFFLIMEKIDKTGWFKPDEASIMSIADQDMEMDLTANEPEVILAGMMPVQLEASLSALQVEEIDWKKVADWLLKRLQELFILLVFGLLGLWLKPKWIPDSAKLLHSRPLAATGWGLLGIVISFNLIGVAVLILIIIIAIGLFLGMLTLWELAWSFMAIGGFSLGFVATAFSLFVIYISKAIVAFLVGLMILNRFAPAYAMYKPLALIIGLVLYVLLSAVPILGWVIGMLATVLGLGGVWLLYKDRRLQAKMSEMKISGEMEMV